MRVAPLQPDEWDDDVVNALSDMVTPDRLERRDAGTALATLARHPRLTHAFLRFNFYLLFGSDAATPGCGNWRSCGSRTAATAPTSGRTTSRSARGRD